MSSKTQKFDKLGRCTWKFGEARLARMCEIEFYRGGNNIVKEVQKFARSWVLAVN
jgi:hypothetical protein